MSLFLAGKLKIIFIIFLTFNYNFISLASSKSESDQLIKNNQKTKLDVDYLNQLPKNDYILGSGDSIRIIVSREYRELDTAVSIDGEGTIYLPKLHRVYVRGLSVSELNNILDKAYKKFVKYPEVETKILSYRPIKILLKGELESPGIKSLRGSFKVSAKSQVALDNISEELNSLQSADSEFNNDSSNEVVNYYFPTVFDAIRSAGGITQFSDLGNVKITRINSVSNGGGFIQTKLNFETLSYFADNNQNIRIYDGDIIEVGKSLTRRPEILKRAITSNLNSRFINVSVTGRVNQPGRVTISRASTIYDAIDMAGGVKVLKGPIKFVRFMNDGSIDKRKLRFSKNQEPGTYNNPFLKNNDFIFVGNSILSGTNEVIAEVTSPFIGIFSTYGLIKALED